MKALIAEDQQDLAEETRNFLEKENIKCDVSHTYQKASELLTINTYDFILLDLGLPDGDGMNLLEEGKKNQKSAIFIILTARGDIQDKVNGLLSGADDYMAKPFSFVELKARMHAILRRKSGWNDNEINFADFVMNTHNRTVHYHDLEITLTKKEFDLLFFLLIHKNKVINRFQLAEHIWGEYFEDDHQSNFIDVHIKNIRKKLGEHAPVDWLETVRGIGYKALLN